MKKIVLIFIIAATIFVMLGCSLKKCDICGGFGDDNEVQAVTTWNLCDYCYYDFQKDKYDYYKDIYDYYKDIYDYYNYGDSNSNSNGRCLDCGKSIPSGRYYCDKCLGYGTCQDCGKKIADDRFYCNDCLYD